MTAMTSGPSPGSRGIGTQRVRSAGERSSGHLREVLAGPRPAQHEMQATTAAFTPLLDGSVPWVHRIWVAAAFLLGVISRDALGDPDAVGPALERALDLAEADQVLLPLLASPASGRPERQGRHPAAPAASISRVVDLLARANGPAAPPGEPGPALRGPDPIRGAGAALPADQPVHAGNRRRALPIDEHRQDASAAPVPEARREQPHRGRRAGPRPRPARTAAPPSTRTGLAWRARLQTGSFLASSSRSQRDGLGWIAVEHVGGVRRRFGVPREDEQAEYVSRHRRATSCGAPRCQSLASAPSQSAMSVRGATAPGYRARRAAAGGPRVAPDRVKCLRANRVT